MALKCSCGCYLNPDGSCPHDCEPTATQVVEELNKKKEEKPDK